VLTPVQERIARSVAEKHAGPISHEDARLKVDLDMLARDAEEALADLRDGAVRAVGDLRHGVNAARKEGASMAEKAERKAEEVVEIADATSDMARSIKNAARKLRTFLGG
jgi:phosphopantothenate synthetase